MKKLMSLMKAAMSQDMDLFRIKSKKRKKFSSIILILILVIAVFYSIGIYAYGIADALKPTNQTYVMLTIFIAFTTILSFIEAIYKSQGILFDAKDNDLLFSLPIEKGKILFIRLFKLLAFQFLYDALFLIPAIVVYLIIEKPAFTFYIIAILMLILIPIIPTVLGAIIGYLIKALSSKFKAKKVIQLVLTMALFFVIFGLSFNSKSMMNSLANNAVNINAMITNIFYPVKLYVDLVNNFNLLSLILLLVINILPLIIFIYIAGISYFNIISKLSENGNNKKTKNKKIDTKEIYKTRKPIRALTIKELKRYFSSPVYIFNTSFGIILMIIITIGMAVNFNGMIEFVLNGNGNGESTGLSIEQIISIIPKVFYELVIFISCMTSITAASISLEGKSFNITKSLPVKTDKILLAKILTSNILEIPLMLLSDIIFFITFKVGVIDIIFIILATLIVPTMTAMFGLLVNLKFPKMIFSSDTEVVKQSTSIIVAVLVGFIFAIASIIAMNVLSANINIFIVMELFIFAIITAILWIAIKKYGVKRFNEINV